MSVTPKLYIAGMGMITPVGANTAMTAAAVKAGISAYAETEYTNEQGKPITMASIPDLILDELEADIGEGDRFDPCHYRIIKMAIIAIREACASQSIEKSIPLVLAMPEVLTKSMQADDEGLIQFNQTLEANCKPWISTTLWRSIYSGRAAGIEAIDFAYRYLFEIPHDFMLIGGSDSYRDDSRLMALSEDNRLLVSRNPDCFAPGEAAAFILLTKHSEFALNRGGNIIALYPPGIADESGHMGSDEPYRGDGLDQAFKKALIKHQQANIHSIYSSMNGENFWAKEYGVAYIRNNSAFQEKVDIKHPAENYGDLGAASSPALIALAAEHLLSNPKAKAHLVYSSSDTAKRGAIVVEKVSYQSIQTPTGIQ